MMHTVANILEIGRLKSNKLTFNMEQVKIDSIINDIYDNYKSFCVENSILIDKERIDGFEIITDRQMLRQLILNLFSNAIKYGQGKIIISTRKFENSTFEISVEDNGPGIDDNQKEKIFHLFEQGDKDVMTRRTTGTGVGLYFVKLLSTELNFSIDIDKSIILGGAKFILRGKL
jgi:signal transduction histidine kinase